MRKACRDKSKSEPLRIVVHPSVFTDKSKEERLKTFIDEWFVPAVVEDYIRQYRKPVALEEETFDSDAGGTES